MLFIPGSFGRLALSFAQRDFLILLLLLFFAPRPCCALPFSAVSTVIRFECHLNDPLVCQIDFEPDNPTYDCVRVLPILVACSEGLFTRLR